MAYARDRLRGHNYIATCLLFHGPLLKSPSVNSGIIKVFLLTVFSADLQCHFLKEDWNKQIAQNQCYTFAVELKQNSFLWIHPTSEVKTFNNITKIAAMFQDCLTHSTQYSKESKLSRNCCAPKHLGWSVSCLLAAIEGRVYCLSCVSILGKELSVLISSLRCLPGF